MSQKQKKKQDYKDKKYQNLLKQIDLKISKQEQLEEEDDDDGHDLQGKLKLVKKNQQNKQNSEKQPTKVSDDQEEITVNDLLARLEDDVNEEQNNASHLKRQQEFIDTKTKLLKEPECLTKQAAEERKANYQIIKDDVQKWIPIIKKNREASHLDFTNKEPRDTLRINTLTDKEIQSNPIANKIEGVLKNLNMNSQEKVKNQEQQLMNKLNPIQAKQQMNELLQKQNLLFYKELKNKRVSKIKSKIFHKIKKKREMKEKLKQLAKLDPEMRAKELSNIQKERIKERISQRHQVKSKQIQNLLRFGEKDQVQQTINDLNQMRQELLKKINQQEEEDFSEEYDDANFREQAINDLKKELQGDQKDDEIPQTGLKFIDNYNAQKSKEAQEEAVKLLEKLQNEGNDEDLLSEQELVEENEHQNAYEQKENQKRKREDQEKKKDIQKEDEVFLGRKKFQKIENNKNQQVQLQLDQNDDNNQNQKLMRSNATTILKKYLKENENEEQNNVVDNQDIQLKNQIAKIQAQDEKKNLNNEKDQNQTNLQQQKFNNSKSNSNVQKQQNINLLEEDNLIKGINIDNLKNKYKKNEQNEFQIKDIDQFNVENKQQLYKDLANFKMIDDNENEEEFIKEKFQEYEIELPEEKKVLQGWGFWTGDGIKKKKEPTKEELLKKKIKLINELKNSRSDGKLDNVILNEKRNKLVTQYLVKELPHPYTNQDQFNYMANVPLGPEWNTVRSTINLTKPKVLTKAGDIINPIRLPKGKQ